MLVCSVFYLWGAFKTGAFACFASHFSIIEHTGVTGKYRPANQPIRARDFTGSSSRHIMIKSHNALENAQIALCFMLCVPFASLVFFQIPTSLQLHNACWWMLFFYIARVKCYDGGAMTEVTELPLLLLLYYWVVGSCWKKTSGFFCLTRRTFCLENPQDLVASDVSDLSNTMRIPENHTCGGNTTATKWQCQETTLTLLVND